MTICSTLSGKVAIKHPKLGVLVRDDGAVFVKTRGSNKTAQTYSWSYGFPAPNGYLRVRIPKKMVYVHRLVAEAFLPNPENKRTVDHWNRIKTDNIVSNLHWATSKEQADNRSSSDTEHLKYGVRKCDDPNAYARAIRATKKQQKAAQ